MIYSYTLILGCLSWNLACQATTDTGSNSKKIDASSTQSKAHKKHTHTQGQSSDSDLNDVKKHPLHDLFNQKHSYQDKSLVLAQVDSVNITQKMLEKHLEKMSPFMRSRYQNPERVQELLASLIRFELLALAAKQAGHDQHPDVILAHKQSMVRTLLKEDLRQAVTMSDIKQTEVETYYQEHKQQYQRPKQVRAAHILIKDAQKAQKILQDLLQQTKQNPSQKQGLFAYQVKLHSQDLESKERRGDLQYFTQEGQRADEKSLPQSLPPLSVVKAAFTLSSIGDIYPQVLHSEQGYHIIQKLGERRALERTLQSVTPEIKNILLKVKKQQMMQEYVDALKQQSTVKTFDDRIQKLQLRIPSSPTSTKGQQAKQKAIQQLMNRTLGQQNQ